MRIALQSGTHGNHTTMMSNLRTKLRQQLRGHIHLWSFLTGIVLCGLLFGGIVAGELNPGDTAVLANSVQHLLISIQQHELASSGDLWWQRVVQDGQILALIWLFGVSVIGIPFVMITLFLRAFSIGFAVGFTVLQFGWKGFLVAGIAIFLHQLITMSVLLFAGIVAIRFSTQILQQSFPVSMLSWRFFKYTFIFVLCTGGLMLGAVVQAYLAPHLLTSILVG